MEFSTASTQAKTQDIPSWAVGTEFSTRMGLRGASGGRGGRMVQEAGGQAIKGEWPTLGPGSKGSCRGIDLKNFPPAKGSRCLRGALAQASRSFPASTAFYLGEGCVFTPGVVKPPPKLFC